MPLYEPLLKARLLLSVDDVNIWISHLKKVQQNRKDGAAKAAKTRRKSRQAVQEQYKCGVCQTTLKRRLRRVKCGLGVKNLTAGFAGRM